MAQLLYTLPETQRTLEEVQAAANGLDEAIETFVQVAGSKNPPYPRHDLELRADMGRNTMRRQLERAIASQREFEEKNAEKLKVARELRDAQQKQRAVEKQREAERLLEQKRKIAEERQKMLEKDREITAKREEEEKVKHELEFTTDSETGERTKKRTKRGGQKKREAGSDGEATDKKKSRKRRSGSAAATTDEESAAPKKRRRLQQREAVNKGNKYKSSEIVVESDSDENGAAGSIADKDGEEADDRKEPTKDDRPSDRDDDDDEDEDEDEDEDIQRSRSARKKNARRALDSDDEDDEAEEDIAAPTSPVKNNADEDLQSTHENWKDAESPSQDEDVAMGDAAPDEPTNEEAVDDDDGA